jgi:hypothetical protein
MRKEQIKLIVSLMMLVALFTVNTLGNTTFAAPVTVVKEKSIASFYGTYGLIGDSKRTLITISAKGITIGNRNEGAVTHNLLKAKLVPTVLILKNGILELSKGQTGTIAKRSDGMYNIRIKGIANLTAIKGKDVNTVLKDKRILADVEKEQKAMAQKVSEGLVKPSESKAPQGSSSKDETVKIEAPSVSEVPKVVALTEEEKELQKIEEELRKKIIIEDDIMLFNLYAFMNYTGYDGENNNAFHPVRQAVREELKSKNIEIRDKTYFKTRNVDDGGYLQYLALIDTNFNLVRPVPSHLNSINDLNTHLSEFYKAADIPNLYNKYKPEYDSSYAKYTDMYKEMAKTIHFLRIDEKELPEFYVSINLLDAYWRGYGLGSTYAYRNDKGIIITGPSPTPNYLNILHEFSHGSVSGINRKYKSDIEGISYLKSSIPFSSNEIKQYNQFYSIVNESMVRAISRLYYPNAERSIELETQKGYVYTSYFYEKFKTEYPTYNGTLDQFIKYLIDDLKSK